MQGLSTYCQTFKGEVKWTHYTVNIVWVASLSTKRGSALQLYYFISSLALMLVILISIKPVLSVSL